MTSKYFSGEGPAIPHLNRGEIADLRGDITRAFEKLETDLEGYQPGGIFDISSFAPNVGNAVEIGSVVANPIFTASYTKVPDSAEARDSAGNPAVDVTATPTGFSLPYSYTKTSNNQYVDFTLDAEKDAVPDSATARITWSPKGYWGTGSAGYSTENDIKLLANSPLKGSRGITFTATAGPAQYVYYAYPTTYGAATFRVDGWEGGFDLIADNISVTNNGVSQNYRLYRSTNANLGTVTVQIT